MNKIDRIEKIDKKINKIKIFNKTHTHPYIQFSELLLIFSVLFVFLTLVFMFLVSLTKMTFYYESLYFVFLFILLIIPCFSVLYFLFSKKRKKALNLNEKMSKKIEILIQEKENIIKQTNTSDLFNIKEKIKSKDTISSILTNIENNNEKDLDLVLLDATFEKLKRNRTISSDSKRDLEFFMRLYREEKKINDKNNIEKRIQKITNEDVNIENE